MGWIQTDGIGWCPPLRALRLLDGAIVEGECATPLAVLDRARDYGSGAAVEARGGSVDGSLKKDAGRAELKRTITLDRASLREVPATISRGAITQSAGIDKVPCALFNDDQARPSDPSARKLVLPVPIAGEVGNRTSATAAPARTRGVGSSRQGD